MNRHSFYSIFYSKCPRCHVGSLYENNNPYQLQKLSKMHPSCSSCNQSFEPETGFYYGAMYVSYGLSILVMFIPAAVLYFIFNARFSILLGTLLGIYVLGFPLLFRLSRNIWLNIFVKFDPKINQQVTQSPIKNVNS